MAKKFYAVRNGRTPGIYYTWPDCQAQVVGFKGASFKSFNTIQDANAYIENTQIMQIDDSTADAIPFLNETIAAAYVDGSYNDTEKTFSYGAVIFLNNEQFELSEKVEDASLVEMRNVAGEICGSRAAIEFALDHGCKEISVYHDYEGIAKWPLGEWKTNKEGTIAYKQWYDSIKDNIKVTFVKVKGHSNNKYNDLADELAKRAIF